MIIGCEMAPAPEPDMVTGSAAVEVSRDKVNEGEFRLEIELSAVPERTAEGGATS
jgi:hypothetical protein